jgi:glycosyltransferase involved in cell wall biosynthesis
VVIGPALDADYAKRVFAQLDCPPSFAETISSSSSSASPRAHSYGPILYHPPVGAADAVAALRAADIVLNTSLSEGMSNVLMEAMTVGAPCAARDNAGNRSLIAAVDDGDASADASRGGGDANAASTGLLFATPDEFVAGATRLLDGGADAGRTVCAALRMMRRIGRSDDEFALYDAVVRALVGSADR